MGVLFVEKELITDLRGSTISPERNDFSEVHTIQIFKSLQEIVCHLTLDV